jgi:hypothetical protein
MCVYSTTINALLGISHSGTRTYRMRTRVNLNSNIVEMKQMHSDFQKPK